MKPLLLAIAALSIASAAQAAPRVQAAWSRPASQGTTGAGFMTLVNPDARPDALIAVQSPLAAQVMIHRSTVSGGVASMQMVASVPVPAAGSVVFGPGGHHLMFVGLTKPLKVGDTLPATLTFASGAKVRAAFVVGLAPPAAAHARH